MSLPRKHSVFIVDDHPLVREWLSALLRASNSFESVGGEASASAACEGIVALKPDFAIVDLALKQSSGLDLIRDLQTKAPETLCLVLSMHDEVHYAEQAFVAGAKAFVAKEEATERIIDALEIVRGGGIYASTQILSNIARRAASRSNQKLSLSTEDLSERELEIFSRLGQGQGTKEIAVALGISHKTVHAYCARIKIKFGFVTAAELVREATLWSERKNGVRLSS